MKWLSSWAFGRWFRTPYVILVTVWAIQKFVVVHRFRYYGVTASPPYAEGPFYFWLITMLVGCLSTAGHLYLFWIRAQQGAQPDAGTGRSLAP
jgi:hypothetical protein